MASQDVPPSQAGGATTDRVVFTTILCPVDFSQPSSVALQHAAALAHQSKGRVTALYVNDPLLVAAAAAAAYDRLELERTSDAELARFIRRAAAPEGLTIDRLVVMGEPAREIARAAERIHADLVVVGTHGLSGTGKWFFGSTTERVLRHATVPILAVPPRARRRRRSTPWPGRRVVAAIDLGPNAASDARRAAAIARGFGARLVLAHVVAPDRAPAWLSAKLSVKHRERLATARAELKRLAGELGPALTVDVRALPGDPAQQVIKLAADARAGLLIVALRKGEGAFGAAQGSITYRVLSSGCTVPVLALPAQGRPALPHLDASAFT